MRKLVTIAVLLTTFLIYSCKKKEAIEPTPAISDIPLTGIDMKAFFDTIPVELLSPATLLTLNGDYTWTMDLGGAISFGYYSWVPTEPNIARIKFYVTEWRHLSADSAKSAKLKDILLEVDKCEFPDPTIVNGVFFSANTWGTYLRTERQ